MSRRFASTGERRARSARLSLRVLLTLAVLSLSILGAPAAQAEQPEPVALTATDPPSTAVAPASSTTPFIMGRGDGAIISSFSLSAAHGSGITSDINPNNVVDIYANGTCSGAPVESGIVDELEGDGIQVEVEADSTTTFSAIQIDPGDPGSPSDCSKPITYWHSSTAEPPAPPDDPPGGGGGGSPSGGTTVPAASAVPPAPRLRTVPGGRANHNTPLMIGSAPGAATVRVFNTSNCAGVVVAKGSAADLAAGLRVQVPDNTETSFSATAAAGGKESGCSESVTYVEDSAAPLTRITMGPGVKTRRRKAVFRFTDASGDPPGTSFLCKVDRKKWKPCSSPFKLRNLGFRGHVLRVRGIDLAGNAEAKAAKRRFKVIRG